MILSFSSIRISYFGISGAHGLVRVLISVPCFEDRDRGVMHL
jgi:hypothetical protein